MIIEMQEIIVITFLQMWLFLWVKERGVRFLKLNLLRELIAFPLTIPSPQWKEYMMLPLPLGTVSSKWGQLQIKLNLVVQSFMKMMKWRGIFSAIKLNIVA